MAVGAWLDCGRVLHGCGLLRHPLRAPGHLHDQTGRAGQQEQAHSAETEPKDSHENGTGQGETCAIFSYHSDHGKESTNQL